MTEYSQKEKDVFGLCSDPENEHAFHEHQLSPSLPVSFERISPLAHDSEEVTLLLTRKFSSYASETQEVKQERHRSGTVFFGVGSDKKMDSIHAYRVIQAFSKDSVPGKDKERLVFADVFANEIVYRLEAPPVNKSDFPSLISLLKVDGIESAKDDCVKLEWLFVARCGAPPGDGGWIPSTFLREKAVDQYIPFNHFIMLPAGIHEFREHLIEENCEENMDFLLDAMEFRKLTDVPPERKKEVAKLIIGRYVDDSAATQINISGATHAQIINDASEPVDDHYLRIFDKAMREVCRMLEKDSYNRFRKSGGFRRFLQDSSPTWSEDFPSTSEYSRPSSPVVGQRKWINYIEML